MANPTGTLEAHRVVRGLDELSDLVGELDAVAWWSMDAEETRTVLVQVTRAAARLAALELALAVHGETVEVAAESGATSTGVWWALATKQTRKAAAGKVKLGTDLDGPRSLTRAALAAGDVLLDQARVIVAAVDGLPDDLDTGLVRQAEERLIELAAVHDADALRHLGDHILSVIAPEVGEERDRRRLEEAERRAAHRRRLTMSPDGHGCVHGRFTIPAAQAGMLTRALHAIAAPRHRAAVDGAGLFVVGRPSAQKMGEAFCELLETLPTESLPKAGRISATVVVTIALADLISGLGAASLDTGGVITAAQARRLACEAQIIPVVLGGQGQVLDLGRGSRFYSHHQNHALAIRDQGCTATGCDWPPSMCHAHHDRPWSRGGTTDLTNGRLLCPHHHARAHDPAYAATIGADNEITFHRRT